MCPSMLAVLLLRERPFGDDDGGDHSLGLEVEREGNGRHVSGGKEGVDGGREGAEDQRNELPLSRAESVCF